MSDDRPSSQPVPENYIQLFERSQPAAYAQWLGTLATALQEAHAGTAVRDLRFSHLLATSPLAGDNVRLCELKAQFVYEATATTLAAGELSLALPDDCIAALSTEGLAVDRACVLGLTIEQVTTSLGPHSAIAVRSSAARSPLENGCIALFDGTSLIVPPDQAAVAEAAANISLVAMRRIGCAGLEDLFTGTIPLPLPPADAPDTMPEQLLLVPTGTLLADLLTMHTSPTNPFIAVTMATAADRSSTALPLQYSLASRANCEAIVRDLEARQLSDPCMALTLGRQWPVARTRLADLTVSVTSMPKATDADDTRVHQVTVDVTIKCALAAKQTQPTLLLSTRYYEQQQQLRHEEDDRMKVD